MKSFATKLRQFLVSEDGPTAVEYAVMLSLIVCVCLAAITTIGTNASQRVLQGCQLDLTRPLRMLRFACSCAEPATGMWIRRKSPSVSLVNRKGIFVSWLFDIPRITT